MKATPKRYLMVKAPGHPIAGPCGRILLHRKVLFERIGPGRHPCHWCGELMEWRRDGLTEGALVADHVDHDKLNNDPGNLVPACNPCNASRIRGECWAPWVPGTPVGETGRLHERCHKGHLLTPGNVYIRPDKGTRSCLTCVRARRRESYETRTPAEQAADRARGNQSIPCPVCGENRSRTSMRRHIRKMHDQVPALQQKRDARLLAVLEAIRSISGSGHKITARLLRDQIPGFSGFEKIHGYRTLVEMACAGLAEEAEIPGEAVPY